LGDLEIEVTITLKSPVTPTSGIDPAVGAILHPDGPGAGWYSVVSSLKSVVATGDKLLALAMKTGTIEGNAAVFIKDTVELLKKTSDTLKCDGVDTALERMNITGTASAMSVKPGLAESSYVDVYLYFSANAFAPGISEDYDNVVVYTMGWMPATTAYQWGTQVVNGATRVVLRTRNRIYVPSGGSLAVPIYFTHSGPLYIYGTYTTEIPNLPVMFDYSRNLISVDSGDAVASECMWSLGMKGPMKPMGDAIPGYNYDKAMASIRMPVLSTTTAGVLDSCR